jgi:hypothetical protein
VFVIGISVPWNYEPLYFETFRIDNLDLLTYTDTIPLKKLEGSPSVSFVTRFGQFRS